MEMTKTEVKKKTDTHVLTHNTHTSVVKEGDEESKLEVSIKILG